MHEIVTPAGIIPSCCEIKLSEKGGFSYDTLHWQNSMQGLRRTILHGD